MDKYKEQEAGEGGVPCAEKGMSCTRSVASVANAGATSLILWRSGWASGGKD